MAANDVMVYAYIHKSKGAESSLCHGMAHI